MSSIIYRTLVTLLYYSPSGVVFFGLKNNGPADLIHETIKLTCSGFEYRRCTQGRICFSPAIPTNLNDSVGSASIPVNLALPYYSHIVLDLTAFTYKLTCTASLPDNIDPNLSNNSQSFSTK